MFGLFPLNLLTSQLIIIIKLKDFQLLENRRCGYGHLLILLVFGSQILVVSIGLIWLDHVLHQQWVLIPINGLIQVTLNSKHYLVFLSTICIRDENTIIPFIDHGTAQQLYKTAKTKSLDECSARGLISLARYNIINFLNRERTILTAVARNKQVEDCTISEQVTLSRHTKYQQHWRTY